MTAETHPSPSLFSTALSRFTQLMGQAREMIGRRLNPPLLLRNAALPPMNPIIAEFAWRRLSRAQSLFLALAARFQAGKLRPSKPQLAPRRTPSARRATSAQDSATRTIIPRHFGWLLGQVPNQIVAPAHYLGLLLAEPELRELLATSPRARRILAPSCHMLGIEKEILTPVGWVSEAPPTTSTLPHAEPTPEQTSEPTPEPPFTNTPGILPPHHLRTLWRPQSDP